MPRKYHRDYTLHPTVASTMCTMFRRGDALTLVDLAHNFFPDRVYDYNLVALVSAHLCTARKMLELDGLFLTNPRKNNGRYEIDQNSDKRAFERGMTKSTTIANGMEICKVVNEKLLERPFQNMAKISKLGNSLTGAFSAFADLANGLTIAFGSFQTQLEKHPELQQLFLNAQPDEEDSAKHSNV